MSNRMSDRMSSGTNSRTGSEMSSGTNSRISAGGTARGAVGDAGRLPRLRLTARGRRVITALVASPVAVAALLFALNGGIATATSGGGPVAFQRVTVQAGQSLWQLAQSLAPAADPRDVVSDIVHLNQLPSGDVRAGQRLAIPQQYAR